jgi:hypothetical protein
MGPAKILIRIFLLIFPGVHVQNGKEMRLSCSANSRDVRVANLGALVDILCYIFAELLHPSPDGFAIGGDLVWIGNAT